MAILEVNNVSIRYMKGDFKEIGLKEYILRNLKGNYHVSEFWADKDISFTLEKGEMLGIIGSNGAGKSTLLKTLSGIMEPSAGSVHREGSIAALLELGSGFDGDLTVRENTYLRGSRLLLAMMCKGFATSTKRFWRAGNCRITDLRQQK